MYDRDIFYCSLHDTTTINYSVPQTGADLNWTT